MYLVKCKDSIMSVENIYNLVLEKEVPKKKTKRLSMNSTYESWMEIEGQWLLAWGNIHTRYYLNSR